MTTTNRNRQSVNYNWGPTLLSSLPSSSSTAAAHVKRTSLSLGAHNLSLGSRPDPMLAAALGAGARTGGQSREGPRPRPTMGKKRSSYIAQEEPAPVPTSPAPRAHHSREGPPPSPSSKPAPASAPAGRTSSSRSASASTQQQQQQPRPLSLALASASEVDPYSDLFASDPSGPAAMTAKSGSAGGRKWMPWRKGAEKDKRHSDRTSGSFESGESEVDSGTGSREGTATAGSLTSGTSAGSPRAPLTPTLASQPPISPALSPSSTKPTTKRHSTLPPPSSPSALPPSRARASLPAFALTAPSPSPSRPLNRSRPGAGADDEDDLPLGSLNLSLRRHQHQQHFASESDLAAPVRPWISSSGSGSGSRSSSTSSLDRDREALMTPTTPSWSANGSQVSFVSVSASVGEAKDAVGKEGKEAKGSLGRFFGRRGRRGSAAAISAAGEGEGERCESPMPVDTHAQATEFGQMKASKSTFSLSLKRRKTTTKQRSSVMIPHSPSMPSLPHSAPPMRPTHSHSASEVPSRRSLSPNPAPTPAQAQAQARRSVSYGNEMPSLAVADDKAAKRRSFLAVPGLGLGLGRLVRSRSTRSLRTSQQGEEELEGEEKTGEISSKASDSGSSIGKGWLDVKESTTSTIKSTTGPEVKPAAAPEKAARQRPRTGDAHKWAGSDDESDDEYGDASEDGHLPSRPSLSLSFSAPSLSLLTTTSSNPKASHLLPLTLPSSSSSSFVIDFTSSTSNARLPIPASPTFRISALGSPGAQILLRLTQAKLAPGGARANAAMATGREALPAAVATVLPRSLRARQVDVPEPAARRLDVALQRHRLLRRLARRVTLWEERELNKFIELAEKVKPAKAAALPSGTGTAKVEPQPVAVDTLLRVTGEALRSSAADGNDDIPASVNVQKPTSSSSAVATSSPEAGRRTDFDITAIAQWARRPTFLERSFVTEYVTKAVIDGRQKPPSPADRARSALGLPLSNKPNSAAPVQLESAVTAERPLQSKGWPVAPLSMPWAETRLKAAGVASPLRPKALTVSEAVMPPNALQTDRPKREVQASSKVALGGARYRGFSSPPVGLRNDVPKRISIQPSTSQPVDLSSRASVGPAVGIDQELARQETKLAEVVDEEDDEEAKDEVPLGLPLLKAAQNSARLRQTASKRYSLPAAKPEPPSNLVKSPSDPAWHSPEQRAARAMQHAMRMEQEVERVKADERRRREQEAEKRQRDAEKDRRRQSNMQIEAWMASQKLRDEANKAPQTERPTATADGRTLASPAPILNRSQHRASVAIPASTSMPALYTPTTGPMPIMQPGFVPMPFALPMYPMPAGYQMPAQIHGASAFSASSDVWSGIHPSQAIPASNPALRPLSMAAGPKPLLLPGYVSPPNTMRKSRDSIMVSHQPPHQPMNARRQSAMMNGSRRF